MIRGTSSTTVTGPSMCLVLTSRLPNVTWQSLFSASLKHPSGVPAYCSLSWHRISSRAVPFPQASHSLAVRCSSDYCGAVRISQFRMISSGWLLHSDPRQDRACRFESSVTGTLAEIYKEVLGLHQVALSVERATN